MSWNSIRLEVEASAFRFDTFRRGIYIGFKVMASRALTPANQITILRLIFVPLFAILVVGRHFEGALWILAAAAVSDAADGTVARLFHQVTPLGVALDPLADKILMTTAYLTLSFREVLPWWLTILVLSRDVTIIMTALLISLVAGYRPFAPTLLGKISTVVQVATVFAAVAYQAHLGVVTEIVVRVCIDLAAIFTVGSGIHYLIVVQHRYSHPTPAPEAGRGEQATPGEAGNAPASNPKSS